MTLKDIEISEEKIEDFCRRWKITEFALFGSILRSDFTPTSDVDVLVAFERDAGWSLSDLVEMQEELKGMLDREVNLVERASLRNPFRRREILRNMKVIYAA